MTGVFRRMRLLTLSCLVGTGACDSAMAPTPAPASLVLEAAEVAIDDGASVRLEPKILDASGQVMPGLPAGVQVSWTSADPAIASVADGIVRGMRPGVTEVTASVGALRATARVTVRQLLARLLIVRGDSQTTMTGFTLRDSLVVRAVDRHGEGVAGVEIEFVPNDFAPPGAAGTVSPARSGTDAGGYARTRWTTGLTPVEHRVEARVVGSPRLAVTLRAVTIGTPDVEAGYLIHAVPAATDLNDRGDLAGVSNGRAFLWRDGAITYLGSASTKAVARMNNVGTVVFSSSSTATSCVDQSWMWKGGAVSRLFPGVGCDSVVGINNRDQVVAAETGARTRGWFWDGAQTTVVEWTSHDSVWTSSSATPIGVSDAGRVAVTVTLYRSLSPTSTTETFAAVWEKGQFTVIPEPDPECNGTRAVDIDQAGRVLVECSLSSPSNTRVWVWEDGDFTHVWPIMANASMNNRRGVVGNSGTGNGHVWVAGQAHTIPARVFPPGLINSRGQIFTGFRLLTPLGER